MEVYTDIDQLIKAVSKENLSRRWMPGLTQLQDEALERCSYIATYYQIGKNRKWLQLQDANDEKK